MDSSLRIVAKPVAPARTQSRSRPRIEVNWQEVLYLVQYPYLVVFLTLLVTLALVVAGHWWGVFLPVVLSLRVLWTERRGLRAMLHFDLVEARKWFVAFLVSLAIVWILLALFPSAGLWLLGVFRSLEGM